jgi:hypothetical protein
MFGRLSKNLVFLALVAFVVANLSAAQRVPLKEQNERLLAQIEAVHGLSAEQSAALRAIFRSSPFIGQGNPTVAVHPMTPEQCKERVSEARVSYGNPSFERICGGKFMAPLYDPATENPEQSRACIDQFEFPGIPCEYPVVWVRAREAALICEAIGKRLCDAHEWEGACAGALHEPDYRFDLAQGTDPATGFRAMRQAHNRVYDAQKVWAYGDKYRTGICAGSSSKTPGCEGGSWTECGSNTFPVGTFPACRSALVVYDLHGNAAEHMNLPLAEDQMASRGSRTLGLTEMKGSWFIFDSFKAHEDACRWRAPFWHGSRVMDENSHRNYHLGFRCCKTLEKTSGRKASPPP